MQGWADLTPKISEKTLDTIKGFGFLHPLPIQSATIPLAMARKDVVVESQTGTGKTLAFVVPLVEQFDTLLPCSGRRTPFGLVVSPTRELAMQTHKVIEAFGKNKHLVSHIFVGGVTTAKKDVALLADAHADIIVATPGRLLSIITTVKGLLLRVTHLVLDEADLLLDMGFEKTIHTLLRLVPGGRQVSLFSATMTDGLHTLAALALHTPAHIVAKARGATRRTPQHLSIKAVICDKVFPLDMLRSLLSENKAKTIVYFGTCASVEYFGGAFFALLGARLALLHRKIKTGRREKIYNKFYESTDMVLFCTDIASRGLDFQNVDFVINFDAPKDPKAFLHRCGRTARTGRFGNAILLLSRSEEAYIELLKIRRIPIEEISEDEFAGTVKMEMEIAEFQRANPEKAKHAFVSFVRFYQSHALRFIFKHESLDYARLQKLFGLEKLPNMPEVKLFLDKNQ
eukprot:GHVN01101193.1.p1 GENE.GHVN01101193.1~~GHVN01101193.1.p1  ORF type:complete len:457 (-),score=38.96 GHVN01101193.1:1252-2622(-)